MRRLITPGTKKRPVSDKAVYWKLTQAGRVSVSLRAGLSSKNIERPEQQDCAGRSGITADPSVASDVNGLSYQRFS
ncbi:hypothetical protein BKP42_66770 [Rhodococcus erythropolis]|uniref:hypothetical protein n=1 Tax=Rhodococcus erythropolis TaxID=1833 RepID=UPI00117A24D9|nr:hypothetical protein [Rhodococcus erythropolis]PBI84964.1 hypothetical protein BKP42_66770 [Rhodococcus erythropolis]